MEISVNDSKKKNEYDFMDYKTELGNCSIEHEAVQSMEQYFFNHPKLLSQQF